MRGLLLTPVLAALLLLGAAGAARADYGPDYLLGYDITIYDSGSWYNGWDELDNRVFASVNTRSGSREYYFSDIASAFYVLREKHGEPIPMRDLQVADSAVQRRGGQPGTRLLDGRLAWYFWDDDRLARGGMPLILAFHSERDAWDLARYRSGRVFSFAALTRELRDWMDDYGHRCYWRGSHNWSSSNWNRAWERRWDGWDMDRERGWVSLHGRRDSRPVVIPHSPPPQHYYRDDWREREWREREERERYERERYERERYEREHRDREEREQQRVERERREREEREKADRERREREDREKRDREKREREDRERREREERERRERARQIEEAPPKGIHPPQKQPEKNPPPPRKE